MAASPLPHIHNLCQINMVNKDLNHSLRLPYTLVIKAKDDESGRYYYGTCLELDGCLSHARTVEELLRNLEEAKRGWLEGKLEQGDPIPQPQEEYSGKIDLRMPRSLTGSLLSERIRSDRHSFEQVHKFH